MLRYYRDIAGDMRRSYRDDGGRLSAVSGRISDVRPQRTFGDDTENSFVLTFPQRDSLPRRLPIQGTLDSDEEGDDENDEDQSDRPDTETRPDNLDEQDFEELDTDGDVRMHVPMQTSIDESRLGKSRAHRTKRVVKVSRYGIEYSSLPPGVVKKLATTFLRTSGNSKAKISKDTLDAIMQASDWFFEQISDNLGTYAEHAGRKTIDESDVLILMGR